MGPLGPPPGPTGGLGGPLPTKVQNCSNSVVMRVLTKISFRRSQIPLKARPRPKSITKISVWAKRGPNYGSQKTCVFSCIYTGSKSDVLGKTKFPKMAIKWARRGVRAIVGYLLFPRNILKRMGTIRIGFGRKIFFRFFTTDFWVKQPPP